jgi:hypothetical protein
MTRGHQFLLLGIGWAAGAAGVVAACSADEVDIAGRPDAGLDQQSSTSDTGSPGTDSGGPGPDSGGPGDQDGGRAIWAFNGYCGAETDAACGTFADCPTPAGGVATTECAAPFERCLAKAVVDSGVSDRIFACEPVGHPIWELNRLCDFESCDGGDAAACEPFEGGVAGQPCSTPLDRCLLNDQRVFVCQPGGTSVYVFNGYCDAGQGTGTCDPSFDACAPTVGGIAGSSCSVDRERCLNGEKIFVCAEH